MAGPPLPPSSSKSELLSTAELYLKSKSELRSMASVSLIRFRVRSSIRIGIKRLGMELEGKLIDVISKRIHSTSIRLDVWVFSVPARHLSESVEQRLLVERPTENLVNGNTTSTSSRECSPIATRTRSAVGRRKDVPAASKGVATHALYIHANFTDESDTCPEILQQEETENSPLKEESVEEKPFESKESKEEENVNEDEEEIWIVQAADDDTELSEDQWQRLLSSAKVSDKVKIIYLASSGWG
ncbi:hypothetical protein EVAR_50109_1 [Eumeta japonica]|uniref:Uncharacterized protein n=1 Tax=Eumeta variegata TaxID=151549 RepID=A0A4C1XUE2_EUMVA|nr:hypothetical protein EVAR_50109_1 [Eumeta japonica]